MLKHRIEARLAIVVALIVVMSLVLFSKGRAYAQTPPDTLFQANTGGTTIDLEVGYGDCTRSEGQVVL